MSVSTHARPFDAQQNGDSGLRAADRPLNVVCLSSQPWHIDLPTNRQQVMARVAEAGHDVVFVETASFLGRHVLALVRGPNRRSLLRRILGTERVSPRIRALQAPTLAPWGHRHRLAARVNAALTSVVIRWHIRRAPEKTVLWLYDPCFADCIGRSGEALAVYDCVDDYAEQAGSDPRRRALVAKYDTLAASRARLVFATARSLVDRHLDHNARTELVRNVGDFGHFAPAADRSFAGAEIGGLRQPVIGFAGNLSAQKIDFELLEALATRRPQWTIVLVGPDSDATRSAVDRITAHENVHGVGAVPYEDLPHYVAGFDVAIIPYLANAYTQSCFPLKTFEYLAAGKPVVAAGLPELDRMEPHVVLANDAEGFIAAVEDALERGSPGDVAARQAVAAQNTWETRTNRLLELVASEL